jgi:hypothetical protein
MTDPADLPLDEDDQAILDRLAAVHTVLDPPPADLDERVSFAIALDSLDAEVARRTEQLTVGSGARASERTQTITFDADSRAVMIAITERPDGLVRVDGWLFRLRRRPARDRATAGAFPSGQCLPAGRHASVHALAPVADFQQARSAAETVSNRGYSRTAAGGRRWSAGRCAECRGCFPGECSGTSRAPESAE